MATLTPFKSLVSEWNNVSKIKVFEFEVNDLRTNNSDWIVFDILIDGTTFRAEHVALNNEEESSDLIAFCSVEIDADFSLDENLQELYIECQTALMDSEFYTLIED